MYSQVLGSFPLIRDIAHLNKMEFSPTGLAYHEIYPFNTDTYEHFTFSPSVFDIKAIFFHDLGSSLTNMGR